MMEALPLLHRPDPQPILRWTLFAGCAAAFFVLSYSSAVTWSEIQEAQHHGFDREIATLAKGTATGTPSRQAAGVALGLLGFAALLARRGAADLRPRGALAWAVFAYVALAAVSVAWADDPQVTLRRVVAFLLLVVAVAGVLRALPADAIVPFALFASAAYVLVGVVAEIATGALRPGTEGYRFSGVFHPNTVGSFCVVLGLAATCLPRGTRGRAAALLVAVGVLLLTRSRASLAALLVVLAVRWLVSARASRIVLALALAAWIGCAAVFTFGGAVGTAIAETFLMSRVDSELHTLGGRTALWEQLLRYSAERPVLGYGLGGFWDPRHVMAVYAAQRWPVADAHNTYLEQLLDLGAGGLVLLLFILGAAFARALQAARTGGGTAAFVLGVVVYYALVGLVEALPSTPTFVNFLFFWAVGLLAFRAAGDLAGRSRCAST
jgi:O-antigen ligase